MVDSFGRHFYYLRLSVTDRCNFRCVYCLPHGYQTSSVAESELDVNEIRRLVQAFAGLGFKKVRLTGGEPTVRRDLEEIVSAVRSVEGIQTIALTTNGSTHSGRLNALKVHGLSAINISVDSLTENGFQAITGSVRRQGVMKAVDEALEVGLAPVKINVVLLKGYNDQELESFTEWVLHKPVQIRFIELMRTGQNKKLFDQAHLSGQSVQKFLTRRGWTRQSRSKGLTNGPALCFSHPEFLGTVGLIAPYSEGFCTTCNRLRISSRGRLRLCLFGDGDFSLRPFLHSDDQRENLQDAVRTLLQGKPEAHELQREKYGDTKNFSGIGG